MIAVDQFKAMKKQNDADEACAITRSESGWKRETAASSQHAKPCWRGGGEIKSRPKNFVPGMGLNVIGGAAVFCQMTVDTKILTRHILSSAGGQVRFRYRDSQSRKMQERSLSGADFLRLILQHVLPKGFRRARLRLSASEQEALDCLAAHRATSQTAHPAGRSQAPPEISLRLLRRADEGQAAAATACHGRPTTKCRFAAGAGGVNQRTQETAAPCRATAALALKMARILRLTVEMA
ncbi:transposase [Azonexus sp.]|uniref:transposase n=1 Tax=Azonexus sp. TaxID=1872668 RepID=UPI0027B90A62|nr:transposase [Azonexus sp.]